MSIDEKLIAAFRDAEPEIKIQRDLYDEYYITRDTYDKRVIETLNQESNMVQ